jgi:pantetheine-phosphate adenylyltransferase
VTVALYAGSFDPIHCGHITVIELVSRGYDDVVVAVLANPDKSSGLLDPEQRLRLVEESTSHLPMVRSVRFHGLVVDLAREVGATVLVRSAHKERANEVSMAAMNQNLTGIPTIFVPVDVNTRSISSSMIRRLVADGQSTAVEGLVPPAVYRALTGTSEAT